MIVTRSTCAAVAAAVLTCMAPASWAKPSTGASTSAPAKGGSGGHVSFKDAIGKFTSEVAATYGVKAKDLTLLPGSEDVVGFDDFKTGDLIPFEASGPNGLRVRGFSDGSSVVLLKKGELGPLFKAAHANDAKAAMKAPDLAARLVWMMGPGFKLVDYTSGYPKYPIPPQIGPATWSHDGKGATLHFFYLQLDQRGGPATPFTAEVKVSADYKAALVSSPGP